MTDDYLFTHDAATVSYDSCKVDGITVDDEGEASFDWSEIPVVELDEPPHARAFDTDQFYKIEGATVARPIKQPYRVGDSIEWYKKPADELRDMAWSLDNAPYTLGHPDTGMVKRTEDVHGFWKNPRYDDEEDRLKEDLYVPANDEEATKFVEENQDVSIGFYNRIFDDYDGDTGDLTDDDVDGFQVNLYGDHVAGVERGRCSGEDGCGLDHDADTHGKVVLETDDPQIGSADSGEDVEDTESDLTEDDGVDGDTEEDCTPCTKTMEDKEKFDISVDLNDVTIDSLAEQFDKVAELREERDEYKEAVDEVREDLDEHGFDVDEDECPCEVVDDVLHENEDLQSEVDDLEEELDEYRAEEKEEALDELSELGAERDEWEEEPLDEIREEIDRREEVLEGVEMDTKGIDTDSTEESTDGETTISGRRRFGRGYNAESQ